MNNKVTAATRFTEHEKNVNNLLNAISAQVEMLRNQFDENGRVNWTFVGDITHLEESLREVHDFLTNQE